MNPSSDEKLGGEQDVVYTPSIDEGFDHQKNRRQHLKHYFTSREGWIGDYVSISSYHTRQEKDTD